MMNKIVLHLFYFGLTLSYGTNAFSILQPSGQQKEIKTTILESSSKIVQNFDPLKNYNIYLVGLHPMKENPTHQMIAFHYCKQVNEDFMQCVLFDNNTKQANLIGIEYIISEKLFNTLPPTEYRFWHPHNYEILSGQLVTPSVPNIMEKQLMKKKMNSYGKTWHVWMAGNSNTHSDKLPLGDAKLAWSFNHDGEADQTLLKKRDVELNIDTSKKRIERQDLVKYAKPQSGVNTLSHRYPGPLFSIPGVIDIEDSNKN